MNLYYFTEIFQPAIESELKKAVYSIDLYPYSELHEMMAYHMGWESEDTSKITGGKRIRPLIVLLTTAAAGGVWEHALPAAAAVELIHNFSLLHDDIEDKSPLRRGRPTIWKKWGIPQAINTGDAMYALAHLTMFKLEDTTSPSITLDASKLIQNTCLRLTQGQFLDISYEDRDGLTLDDYWPMVTGKTAALIAASNELGALVANSNQEIQKNYRDFGFNLGLAFQILDDFLGVWGESEKIGKSIESDLVTGKKTLPILYGLEKQGEFAKLWNKGNITQESVPTLVKQLEKEGGRKFTLDNADRLTRKALKSLDRANPRGEAGIALKELANQLLQREV
jgi:geranylgeranyl diphosphate synthase type I